MTRIEKDRRADCCAELSTEQFPRFPSEGPPSAVHRQYDPITHFKPGSLPTSVPGCGTNASLLSSRRRSTYSAAGGPAFYDGRPCG